MQPTRCSVSLFSMACSMQRDRATARRSFRPIWWPTMRPGGAASCCRSPPPFFRRLTAIAVVGVAAALLGATAKAMGNTVRVIEIVSYALILLIGLRLLWVKGRAFLRRWVAGRAVTQPTIMAIEHGRHHHHHDHEHEHEASAWSHGHAPEPSELAGGHWLKRGLTAIVAVGLRPCSGAIIVLVFALAQGLFWIGVASTFVMGLGTAITVAAIATLAVGARGLAGKLAKAKPGAGVIILRAV